MTVLVTGGAGFIGSHVVDALLARGDSIVCVDELNNAYDPKRKRKNFAQHKKNKLFYFIKLDIRNKKALSKVFRKHQVSSVIHLAARAGVRPSLEQPELYLSVNVIGTLSVLDCAKENGVSNIVVASSSSVYGNSAHVPFREDEKLDEQISPYAVSKKATENLCACYSSVYGLQITCLRFFTVYGPRGRPDMAPFLFIDAAHKNKTIPFYGDGTTSRDYTYIADVVKGVLASHDKPQRFEVINLGNSKPVTLAEFVRTIEKIVGKKLSTVRKPIQPGDVSRTYADLTKAQRLLKYQPTTDLSVGLARTYAWYKEEVA